jgi:hypothetical protein
MSRLKDKYESLRPLIVWLGLTELAWISYWLLRTGATSAGYTTTVVAWIVAMLGWLVLAIYLGRRGFFLKHTRWLSNLVGAVMVVTFAIVAFGAVPPVREGLISAAIATTDGELVSIHILRLLAIGTIVKYLQRQLPLHFLIFGSLPDFLFAISAVVVAFLPGRGFLDQEFLIGWHAIGILVFFGAGISMFFSMPSPFRIFHAVPDTSIVFRFPMLLAPNFTVPLFMLAHVFALVKLIEGG